MKNLSSSLLLLGSALLSFSAQAGQPGGPALGPQRAQASGSTFNVGDNVVNLGVGLGSRYSYAGSGVSVSPAFSLGYERGLRELGPGTLGVGVYAGYQGAKSDFGGYGSYKFTDVIVGVRGAFHYPLVDKLDTYAGLGLGIRHAGVKWEGSSTFGGMAASSTGVYSGLFLGARYYFTESIGAFAELGYDQSYLKVGLAAKF
ncbi:hypothetical protein EJV47_27080 [Hymenobacter gummosus]|uniref:Outer membrane protein beta-barrel domain-containing protein n=1 Tax=Hymenobacter gummosus TaxID=1776032 RepID=A0A3S0J5B7_9BACT|nr:hypothetical protein [Hymenobacter gummosus]RTQ44872.1 hypothetical protein EJV47_27080 [Hymenobacter gummosus]